MIVPALVGPRGRGLTFPAARYFAPLLLVLAILACGKDRQPADNSVRSIAASAAPPADPSSCAVLPDTMVELLQAVEDRNDFPDTRLELNPACQRATVVMMAGARLQRTYRVRVKAGQTLVARARGEHASVALAFDYPATPKPDSSNLGRTVVDSLNADADREVAVRVMLVPHVKNEPRESRVLLTVLARP